MEAMTPDDFDEDPQPYILCEGCGHTIHKEAPETLERYGIGYFCGQWCLDLYNGDEDDRDATNRHLNRTINS